MNDTVDTRTPSRRVILHIGLHKTGTRFLQREVFRQLDDTAFAVNPPTLWRAVRNAVRYPDDASLAAEARHAVADWRSSDDRRTLIISEPHISGDMYSNHHDYAENLALVRELFPEALIVYFVRDQADWLQSAYRQQLVRGASVPIHVFLNHYDGDFRPRLHRWTYGARTVEALNQRFLTIYHAYAEAYGPDRVYLFRQEDLRANAGTVKAALAGILGIDALPTPPRERTRNRSYSALAIRLFHPSAARRYPAPTAADTGRPRRRAQWLVGRLRRLRRILVQHGFDKLVYKDWDLLAEDGLRERINAHYARENEEIRRIAARQITPGPSDSARSDDRRDAADRNTQS